MRLSRLKFESSVVLDGTKTYEVPRLKPDGFESSVVLDGTKTRIYSLSLSRSLRVVLF